MTIMPAEVYSVFGPMAETGS